MKTLSLHYILVFLCVFGLQGDPTAWKLAKNNDGIKVWTRKHHDSKLLEFKTSCQVNASLGQLKSFIQNIDNTKNWMADVNKSRLLKKGPDGKTLAYYECALPWPFSNRDIVIEQNIQIENSHFIRINLTSKPNAYPLQKDKVRIRKAEGYWKIQSLNEGKCELCYQFFSDPEGNIPDKIVNRFLVNNPFQSMKNIRIHFNQQN